MSFVSMSDLQTILTDLGNKLRRKPTVIRCTQAEYNALTNEQKHDTTKTYFVTDGQGGSGIIIDDTTIGSDKVWSSQKTSTELNGKVNISVLGVASGVATLGSDGKVTSSQLPAGIQIDDTTTSSSAVWSSQKTSTELSSKVNTSLLGAADGVATLDSNSKIPNAQIPIIKTIICGLDKNGSLNGNYGFKIATNNTSGILLTPQSFAYIYFYQSSSKDATNFNVFRDRFLNYFGVTKIPSCHNVLIPHFVPKTNSSLTEQRTDVEGCGGYLTLSDTSVSGNAMVFNGSTYDCTIYGMEYFLGVCGALP